MKGKKAQTDAINIIAGLIIISGGALVIFNYINLGLLMAGLGTVIEAIKLVMQSGIR